MHSMPKDMPYDAEEKMSPEVTFGSSSAQGRQTPLKDDPLPAAAFRIKHSNYKCHQFLL